MEGDLVTTPTLLLAPGRSRDEHGSVSPTVDATVTVVSGQYGDAWSLNGGQITVPFGAALGSEGTIISRVLIPAAAATLHYQFLHANSSLGLYLQRRTTGHFSLWMGGVESFRLGTTPADATVTLAIAYNAGGSAGWINGGKVGTGTTGTPTWGTQIALASGGGQGHIAETHIFYDTRLPDAEIVSIMTAPQAWTWDFLTPRARIFPILKVGSQQRIGPLRAGKA